MQINIRSIPHSQQRYETCGDWVAAHGRLRHVMVSEMENEDYAFLVAIHEQIEAWLCLKRGITQEQVDEFDMQFEEWRLPGDDSEPGDYDGAPYHAEHCFATAIERRLAAEMGVDWKDYEGAILSLSKEPAWPLSSLKTLSPQHSLLYKCKVLWTRLGSQLTHFWQRLIRAMSWTFSAITRFLASMRIGGAGSSPSPLFTLADHDSARLVNRLNKKIRERVG
jgi:hypothetical protein